MSETTDQYIVPASKVIELANIYLKLIDKVTQKERERRKELTTNFENQKDEFIARVNSYEANKSKKERTSFLKLFRLFKTLDTDKPVTNIGLSRYLAALEAFRKAELSIHYVIPHVYSDGTTSIRGSILDRLRSSYQLENTDIYVDVFYAIKARSLIDAARISTEFIVDLNSDVHRILNTAINYLAYESKEK